MGKSDIDKEFFDIANEMALRDANKLLDKQLEKVVDWRRDRQDADESAELRDLIMQMIHEPFTRKRGPVLIALAAAIWRLLEQEGEL